MNDQPTENPFEDRVVYALAASPAFASDGICFAATAGGLFVSSDGAMSFSDAYASLKLPEALPTVAVALSPGFTFDHTVFAGVHGAILRSFDRGAAWQYAELRTPPPVVTCLAVSPTYEQDSIVFAGTLEDGIFRSADRGARWAAWNFGLIDLSVLCLALSPAYGQDETLLAGTETGLFRSTNGGRAWRELGLPSELAPVLSVVFSSDYATDGLILAGTESNGLWLSRDRGRSWESVEALGDSPVNALIVDRTSDRLVIAALAGEHLFVSHDGGKGWNILAVGGDVAPMCLFAPAGLGRGAPLLLGGQDGVVRQMNL
ncbi:MAG: WD40/YVTN/BNR-like repeat-containing protein [Nitrososphaerales archaeon]